MKTTKRALFSSIMALILCFSMLVGTTFAWFTDSVESGVNQIVAGNLDVEVFYGDPAAKNSIQDVKELFDDVNGKPILWEPGAVAYEKLTVANLGTLALKYQLAINFTNENEINSTGAKLSQVLKIAVVDAGALTSREAALTAAKNAENAAYLHDFTLPGELAATETKTYGIVIWWEPSADDNNWNVNNGKTTSDGKEYLHIDLGIKLVATQLASEADSFDEYYDGAAVWYGDIDLSWYDPDATELTIGTAEQLAGLAAIVNGTATAPATTFAADSSAAIQDDFAGQTIKLASDINLNNLPWTPIGYNGNSDDWNNAFNGTFDGQGHTIYNLYINAPEGEGVGLFGVVQNATIKGVNLHNVNITGYSMVAGVVGAAYPANISDCHITGDVNIVADWAYVAGVAGYCYYRTQVDGCSVIAEGTGLIQSVTRNAVGGITAWLLEGDHKVTDCQVKNLNLVGWTNVGGITGFVHYSNTISGCTVENVKLTKTRQDGNPGIGLIAGGWSYHASNAITLRNNTVKNATLEGTHIAYSAYNVLYGSEYGGATTTNFVLDGNTTENIVNNLVVVTKLTDGIIENNGVKQIYNANGLKSLSATRISGTYELIADIDMGGADFSAMIVNRSDSAAFNGNGYTISNVNVISGADDNTTGQASMFYAYPNATLNISDLTLKNITVTAEENDTGYAAAVIGFCEGTAVLNNVDVVGATVNGAKSSGMLVGHLSGSLTATNCDVTGTISLSEYEADGHYAGEYLGTMAGNVALNDCTANVTIGGNLKSTNVGVIYGRKVSGVLTISGVETVVVSTADALQTALDDAAGKTNVILAADITGNVTVTQKADVDVVIDGNGHQYTGTITVNGDARSTGAETLTIKNINFVSDTAVDFISAPSKINSRYNYSHNITVDNCTFSAPEYNEDVVGIKVNSSYNLKVTNCTATNIHSLLQAESCGTSVTVDICTVIGCKSGVSFNNTKNAVIKNSRISAVGTDGYGVRVKAEQANYSLTVVNCKISAFVPVLVRNATATYTVTMDGENSLTSNNAFNYGIVVCTGDWDNDANAPAAPTGNVTLTGVEGFSVFKG